VELFRVSELQVVEGKEHAPEQEHRMKKHQYAQISQSILEHEPCMCEIQITSYSFFGALAQPLLNLISRLTAQL
jgi:hypothetical protein